VLGTLAGLSLVAGLWLLAWTVAPASGEARSMNASRVEVERFAGGSPDRCVFSAPDREMCRWRIEGRVIRAGGTGESSVASGVNLLCELPIDPASPETGFCNVHALEPGAAARLAQTEGLASLPPVSAAHPEPIAAPLDPLALAVALSEARTLRDLSRLLGDIPESCRTGAGVQTCRWELSEGSVGEMLFASAPGMARPVELLCRLPLDGSARPAESCLVKSAY
jgi:hypothetical protein